MKAEELWAIVERVWERVPECRPIFGDGGGLIFESFPHQSLMLCSLRVPIANAAANLYPIPPDAAAMLIEAAMVRWLMRHGGVDITLDDDGDPMALYMKGHYRAAENRPGGTLIEPLAAAVLAVAENQP